MWRFYLHIHVQISKELTNKYVNMFKNHGNRLGAVAGKMCRTLSSLIRMTDFTNYNIEKVCASFFCRLFHSLFVFHLSVNLQKQARLFSALL